MFIFVVLATIWLAIPLTVLFLNSPLKTREALYISTIGDQAPVVNKLSIERFAERIIEETQFIFQIPSKQWFTVFKKPNLIVESKSVMFRRTQSLITKSEILIARATKTLNTNMQKAFSSITSSQVPNSS